MAFRLDDTDRWLLQKIGEPVPNSGVGPHECCGVLVYWNEYDGELWECVNQVKHVHQIPCLNY